MPVDAGDLNPAFLQVEDFHVAHQQAVRAAVLGNEIQYLIALRERQHRKVRTEQTMLRCDRGARPCAGLLLSVARQCPQRVDLGLTASAIGARFMRERRSGARSHVNCPLQSSLRARATPDGA